VSDVKLSAEDISRSVDATREQMRAALTPRDEVNHPSHYTLGGIEVIDAIEAWDLGFHLGNCVKYVARAGKKDAAKTLEDLRKARWYLDREIARRSKPPQGE
jgi:hypothetical protein